MNMTRPGFSQTMATAAAAGMAAASRQKKPAVLLWTLALVLVLSYYYIPWVHGILDRLAALKLRTGLLYAAVSSALARGLFPLLVHLGFAQGKAREQLPHLPFFLGFWAIKGIEVDLVYRGLDLLVFQDPLWIRVATKTALDMSLYTPLWVVPTIVLAYLWKDLGYDMTRLAQMVKSEGLISLLLPVLIVDWAIWFPAVAMIYCFPLALQLPLQNIILCLWTIILLSFKS